MTLRSENPLDDTDWRILDELQGDGRVSFNELGRRVSLSPPSVAERVRRMESLGIISGYPRSSTPHAPASRSRHSSRCVAAGIGAC
jgi:Lrp/AsnC family leucine-responsive transcriptional regulator